MHRNISNFFSLYRKECALTFLSIVIFYRIFTVGANLGLDQVASFRYTISCGYAIALSELIPGHPKDYTVYPEALKLGQLLISNDIPEIGAVRYLDDNLQNVIEKLGAEIQKNKSKPHPCTFREDKGLADFAKLAIQLFGFRNQSLYYTYYIFLGLSIATYILHFFKSPVKVSLLIFFLLSLYALTSSTILFDYDSIDLASVHEPRIFGLLSTIPLLHILLILCDPPLKALRGKMLIALLTQTLIILFAIHCRSILVWQAFLIYVSAVLFFFIIRRKSPITRSTLLNLVLPVLLVFFGHTGLKIYQKSAFNPEYFSAKYIAGHETWHSANFSFSIHPQLQAKYVLDSDTSLDQAGQRFSDKPCGTPGVQSGSSSPVCFEEGKRRLFFHILKHHPLESLESFFYYKPKYYISAFKELMRRTSGSTTHYNPPRGDGKESVYNSPRADSRPIDYNPFRAEIILFLLAVTVIIPMREMGKYPKIILTSGLVFVTSLVPPFLTIPRDFYNVESYVLGFVFFYVLLAGMGIKALHICLPYLHRIYGTASTLFKLANARIRTPGKLLAPSDYSMIIKMQKGRFVIHVPDLSIIAEGPGLEEAYRKTIDKSTKVLAEYACRDVDPPTPQNLSFPRSVWKLAALSTVIVPCFVVIAINFINQPDLYTFSTNIIGKILSSSGEIAKKSKYETRLLVDSLDLVSSKVINLALKKPVKQSSYQNFPEVINWGVDGVKGAGIAFHTDNEVNPWWQVDLEQTGVVNEIRLYRYQKDMLVFFHILLSDDGVRWRTVYTHNGALFGGIDGDYLRIKLRNEVARYVRLQLIDHGELSLEEVEVYGVDEKLNERLFIALDKGDIDAIKLLTGKGANINTRDKGGNTALIHAIRKGRIQTVRWLLTNGANTDDKDPNGETPLIIATDLNREDIVQLLIKMSADINIRDNNNQTALLHAIKKENLPIVEMLINNGANIEETYDNGETPLIANANMGRNDITKLLLSKGANVNAVDRDGNTALNFAIVKGQIDAINILIDWGADLNKEIAGISLLLYAIGTDKPDIVKILLNKGADMEMRYQNDATPLMIASALGREKIVQLLILKGADLNVKDKFGNTALMIAQIKGNTKIIQILKGTGALD